VKPIDIVKRSGAEIVRWWALATDWRNDVRIGDEILVRVAEAYRKVRNTFRFLLGNLHDFDPAQHSVPTEKLTRVDRAFLGFLESRVEQMRAAYARLEFHRVLDLLLDVCTVHLSAVFLDVAKDRLYTLGKDDAARRSAQTVAYRALRDLCLVCGPSLVFTAEEVWQHHPALIREYESVHLAILEPSDAGAEDESDWTLLLEARAAVNAAIEPLRAAKTIATTQEARVSLSAGAAGSRLEAFASELRDFMMVADLELQPGAGSAPGGDGAPAFEASATPADPARFKKCERCWNYRDDVSEDSLCGRCRAVLAGKTPVA